MAAPRYEYGYDGQGNHTLIRDPLGRETHFTFDVRGYQLSRTLPLGVESPQAGDFTETFSYDLRGRQTLHVSFEGVVTRFEYDAATGQLVEKHFFADSATYNNGAGTPDEIWIYAYDAFGREWTVIQDGDGNLATTADQHVTSKEYDPAGRLATVLSIEGTIHYEYDQLGRQVRVWTGADSQTVGTDNRYRYDALGRLESVATHVRNGESLSQPEATRYTYDLAGNLDQVRSPNGVIADYDYDGLHRLDLLRHYRDANASGTYEANVDSLLAEFDYDVLLDGRRSGVTEKDDAGRTTRIDWSYDAVGRLMRESFNSHDDSLDFIADYLFDLVGNRLGKLTDTNPDWPALAGGALPSFDETVWYTYDSNDRLLTEAKDVAGGTTEDRFTRYEYGPGATTSFGGNGTQQTKKTVREGLNDSGNKLKEETYTYNLQGRMSQALIDEDGNGVPDTKLDYGYDSDGARVRQTVTSDTDHDGSFANETPVETTYLSDKRNPTGYSRVLEENDASGNITKSYTLGHDIIAQTDAAGNVYFLLKDGHGSTRALLNSSGQIVAGQVYAYDAFGNAIGFDPSSALTTVLYSGERTDSATGLQYLGTEGGRYYRSGTGTFTTLDSFVTQDPQALHKYLYCHGDPVNYADPSGMFSVGQTFAAIGIGLNIVSLAWHLNEAGNAWAKRDSQGFAENVTWAMMDALFLGLPFSGPGSTATRAALSNTGQIVRITTYQLSRLGVQASAVWGYASTLAEALTGLNFSYSTASTGGGGYKHERSEGSGDWYSGEYFEPGPAADFQAGRTGKPAGWFYRLTGFEVKFDGLRQTLNQVLEVKHSGYDYLLQQEWFQSSETGGKALVSQAENQLNAARAHGMRNIWEVKGQASANAIETWLRLNRIAVGPGGIEIVVIP